MTQKHTIAPTPRQALHHAARRNTTLQQLLTMSDAEVDAIRPLSLAEAALLIRALVVEVRHLHHELHRK